MPLIELEKFPEISDISKRDAQNIEDSGVEQYFDPNFVLKTMDEAGEKRTRDYSHWKSPDAGNSEIV